MTHPTGKRVVVLLPGKKKEKKKDLHRDEPTPTGGAWSTPGRKFDSSCLVAEVDGLDRVSPDGVACVRESRSPGPELLLQ